MPNAIIYIRVSTEEQAQSGLGLEAQETECRAAAARLGRPVAFVFADEGLSGSLPPDERPGLLDAIGSLGRGDVLIVWRRDRLARGGSYLVGCIEFAVEQRKASVVSATEEYLNGDDPDCIFLRQIKDACANLERLTGKLRTRVAMKAKAKRKERTGALRYGYDLAADGPRSKRRGLVTALVANQKEQIVISHMQKWRAAGKSYRAIARRLNEGSIPSKTGRSWSHDTVKAALDYAELVA